MNVILMAAGFSLLCSASMQAAEKNIAIFFSSNTSFYSAAATGIKKKLNKKTGLVITEYMLNNLDSIKAIKNAHPDLLITIGTEATDVAVKQFPTIPTIFSMVLDPHYSGPNITGISLDMQPHPQFELLKSLCPLVRKIGVLYSLSTTKDVIDRAKLAAHEMNIELVSLKVDSFEDVYSAIRFLGNQVDALWMVPDTTIYTTHTTQDILLYSLRKKLPVIGLSPAYVKAGALFSLSYDYEDIGRQTGTIALQILDGTSPELISLETPSRIDTTINTITAKCIGIKIPKKILNSARYVYH
ncbi:MAG: ABC transporter substrate-binding protein [Endomicrobiales bacterium]